MSYKVTTDKDLFLIQIQILVNLMKSFCVLNWFISCFRSGVGFTTKKDSLCLYRLQILKTEKYFADALLFQARVNVIRENWNLPYSAAFVTCDLYNRTSRQYLRPPLSVSIISKRKYVISIQSINIKSDFLFLRSEIYT